MPPFSSTSLLTTLVSRNATPEQINSTAFQVVCAWPVSGQYGPGSRVLYYVLVAACVFARKTKWLKNASLAAAALLLPAIAALHGIVLASVHRDGAVDMDLYGAFQFCAIGILAAPVTVKYSGTYFFAHGRNTIFLWAGLIVAGLLSLTVEFFRSTAYPCLKNDNGTPISPNGTNFFYGTSCGLSCTPENGPNSPLRQGSANNIYVIPAPSRLTFGAATLLAAACCIVAILSLASTLNKISKINWKTLFRSEDEEELTEETTKSTNGDIIENMPILKSTREFLTAVEIPVFGAAVLAILIIGEMNFFSTQVQYQTEPIASIGQWAPIVGTVLAVSWSLCMLFLDDPDKDNLEPETDPSTSNCNCACERHEFKPDRTKRSSELNADLAVESDEETSRESTINRSELEQNHRAESLSVDEDDPGGRRKIAGGLIRLARYFTPGEDLFDDTEFRQGKARRFPVVPGEAQRHGSLAEVMDRYEKVKQANENSPAILAKRKSRTGSFNESIKSELSLDEARTSSKESDKLPDSLGSPSSPSSQRTPQRARARTVPTERDSFELQDRRTPLYTGYRQDVTLQPRTMLEVPPPAHIRPARRNTTSNGNIPNLNRTESRDVPAITVSSDSEPSSPTQGPAR